MSITPRRRIQVSLPGTKSSPSCWSISSFWLLLLVVGEIAARLSTDYEIGYYTEAKAGRDGKLRYPWGVVPVNAQGYLDEEFDLASTKPRVGWFGDSVAMGVGAGYPYRISDLVRSSAQRRRHLEFLPPRRRLRRRRRPEDDRREIQARHRRLSAQPQRHPSATRRRNPAAAWWSINGLAFVKEYLDYFRDRSYLYNYVRTAAKNAMQRLGFEASGYFAFELWPDKSDDVFKSFAERVNATARNLRAKGVQMCVVIAPYEMQVSERRRAHLRQARLQMGRRIPRRLRAEEAARISRQGSAGL